MFGPRTGGRRRRGASSRPRGAWVAASTTEVKILVPGHHPMVALLGQRDQLLKLIESAFSTGIHVRGNEITISGESAEAERVATLFEELIGLLEDGHALTEDDLTRSIGLIKNGQATPR